MNECYSFKLGNVESFSKFIQYKKLLLMAWPITNCIEQEMEMCPGS